MDLGRVLTHAPREKPGGARDAAVLVPLVERDGDWHVLFTKRAAHLGEHASQMSFPGGGDEPGDATLQATALREAWEEIGLQPEEVTVIGRLDDIRTVTGYRVRPFVGIVADREYYPNFREVEKIVVLGVTALADPANYATERRRHPERGEITVQYFTVGEYTVWGATARILAQFLRVAARWHPPVDPPTGRPPPDQVAERHRDHEADDEPTV